MTRQQLVDKAVQYLKSRGYRFIRRSPAKGIDLLMFGEDKNKPILVAVCDANKVRSIPMNGFGYSKAGRERAKRFSETARRWMDAYCFGVSAECDAVWVGDSCISHCTALQI